nr:uncharacterized mitochondrial protein AtMg00810-like [Tanacetum cinerariifolium]
MKDDIFFNQSKYIKGMLKKFVLEDSKPMKAPMSSDMKLTKDEECESLDSTKYRGMICSLLYLTASRHDIMFSACLCARFQEDPKTSHLEAVKRIFRYIKGTMHLGLWYPKGTDIETVYAESDHVGDYVDRKSTSGIYTFVGCCLISWFSKKQTALAIFTTEAVYISAKKACQQALWMKQALIDYDIQLDDVLITYNLAFFVAKRMKLVTRQSRLILPYGTLLIRLFNQIMSNFPELSNDRYVLYDRVMYPLSPHYERKKRKDYGKKRGRPSTFASSSSTFDHPSSSHQVDDDNDENDEGTSRASTPSPTRFVNSLSNDVPQVFSNPPHNDPIMEALFTRQTKILDRQVQLRDEHLSGLRSIEKGIRNLWKGKKK